MSESLIMELVERMRSRFYGKYRGTVTNVNSDGRIRAYVPAVLGDQKTGWCMPCVPYAGKDAAIAFLPEVDSGVWIEFEGGDVSCPIWTGCYWHTSDIPSSVAANVKVIQTPDKQQIVLDGDAHSITITDSNHNTVTLDRKGITLIRGDGKIVLSNGKLTVNNGAMEVT